jgi:hypothetical protein
LIQKRLFLGLAGTMWVGTTMAQPSSDRVVAIVSLVADKLTVTGFESTTGTNLNVNPTESLPLTGDALERAVLRTAMSAVNNTKAGRAVPLLVNDAQLYAIQDQVINGETARVPDSLLQTLVAQKATHLVLVTKHRAVANMKTGVVQLGSGRVEGLGFYIDRIRELHTLGTGHRSVGYLAPHVFVRVSLIDLPQSKVIATRTVTASTVVTSNDKTTGADPWDLLDSAAKMKAIEALIVSDCKPAIEALFAS